MKILSGSNKKKAMREFFYKKNIPLNLNPGKECKTNPDFCYSVKKTNINMKDLKRYYNLKATPADIYSALTNAVMLEIWTGEKAVMEPKVNTEFSLWDGSVVGINLEFEKNKKVVQQWFFGDEQTPSIVTIKLHPNKEKTSVELSHTNIPDDAYQNISEGWDEDFFGALNELFI